MKKISILLTLSMFLASSVCAVESAGNSENSPKKCFFTLEAIANVRNSCALALSNSCDLALSEDPNKIINIQDINIQDINKIKEFFQDIQKRLKKSPLLAQDTLQEQIIDFRMKKIKLMGLQDHKQEAPWWNEFAQSEDAKLWTSCPGLSDENQMKSSYPERVALLLFAEGSCNRDFYELINLCASSKLYDADEVYLDALTYLKDNPYDFFKNLRDFSYQVKEGVHTKAISTGLMWAMLGIGKKYKELLQDTYLSDLKADFLKTYPDSANNLEAEEELKLYHSAKKLALELGRTSMLKYRFHSDFADFLTILCRMIYNLPSLKRNSLHIKEVTPLFDKCSLSIEDLEKGKFVSTSDDLMGKSFYQLTAITALLSTEFDDIFKGFVYKYAVKNPNDTSLAVENPNDIASASWYAEPSQDVPMTEETTEDMGEKMQEN